MEVDALETLVYSVEEGVATVTLNRPAQRNALDRRMRAELAEVLHLARRDRGVHALILGGAGGHFCAGGDLRAATDPELDAESAREMMLEQHLWLEELLAFDRPVIAAVEGAAFGAGFALALTADLILASTRARFCPSFLRLGLIPGCGVMHTLPRFVGVQRAKELIFSARELGAEEAERLGIVLEIHSSERLAARARELALSFGDASPTALSITKRGLNAAFGNNLTSLLEIEASGQGITRSSEYHRAAAGRFFDKAGPAFKWPERTD